MTAGNEIKKVLIFDDDRDYRKLVRAYLAKSLPAAELVEYDPVANGAPGEDFNWAGYDVMVLDYYLCIYGTTGLDILQKNRKKPGFPATIMLTGAGDQEVAMRALDFGVYEYLRKEKLTKEELLNSINNAFRKHHEKLIEQKEQERINNAFDKALFYRQLEHPTDAAINDKQPVLLLIGIDNPDALTTEHGLIVQDNLLRQTARQCFEKFSSTDSNPCITRLGDSSLGVLIDFPGTMESLENILRELCGYFSGNSDLSGDKIVSGVANIGALILDREGKTVSSLIELTGQARDIARQTPGNSWHIFTLSEILESENKRQQEEEQRRKEEEERIGSEAERLRQEEEEQRRKEEERLRQVELEKQRSEDEERIRSEAERLRREEEDKRIETAEQMHKTRLERQQRVQDERQKALIKEQQRLIAERKRKAEQERMRVAELERLRQEEQRRLEEKRHKEEEERLRQAELERQRREEEERIDAEEERLRLAEPERQRQKELSIQKEKQANIDILAFPLEIETYPEESEKPDSKTESAIEITEVSKEEAAGPEAELDESSLNLKRAFNDNRIIQTFQPVVAMFSPESGVASTIYKIDIQLVDMAGTVKSAREINRQNTSLSLQQDIDRWMLREIIGGVVRSKNFRSGKIYLLAISEAWLTDTTLFAWLKKLLTGVENIKPGKLIALEIPAGLLLTHKKRALALIRILKNSHGFRIALGSINTLEELTSLSGLLDFNLLTIRYKLTEEIRNNPGYNGDINFLQTLKSHGTRVIIDGIEDSTMLTDAISLGADYVMGIFIGEPQSSLAGTGNVESFDISY
ncbi:MAG: hypothetical protein A2993_01655 [Gammaproteobacteria bacterium RIFCSPLOWO2_01_FULL_47_190]|nr:MAG: hypothetical protein A2993_01655 [Gammaproteobacteria bacterium RIFCSPLOWO2_01_FULL_47_190]OGT71514.1 MAG: hypothetical protein A2W76_04320 [Gammaproteobacteria bacterium RIFCSPLOWO2_12_47_11]